MTVEELYAELQSHRDRDYAAFAARCGMPTPTRPFLGVRIPYLRKLAKRIARAGDALEFISKMQRQYADEYILQALIINEIRDAAELIGALERFLPLVDTWGVCDALSPRLFKEDTALCLKYIPVWLESEHTYTQRFGVVMLLKHFTRDGFCRRHLAWLAELPPSREVDMAVAWYFAEALVFHPREIVATIAENTFSHTIRYAAIQKARESQRIPNIIKDGLARLRTEMRAAGSEKRLV